jgi:energy-coupling factor transport system substrate-specific component
VSATVTRPEKANTPPSRRGRLTTRTILTSVAIGAAVGVILIPLNFVSQTLTASLPMVMVIFYGVWGVAALVPLGVLQRGGTGIIGSAAAGLVSSLSPYGLSSLVTMILWGLLMELPFLVARYRRFGWGMFLTAGLVVGAIGSALSVVRLDLTSMSAGFAASLVAVEMASFVVCSLLSLAIARALRRAGIGGARPVSPPADA